MVRAVTGAAPRQMDVATGPAAKPDKAATRVEAVGHRAQRPAGYPQEYWTETQSAHWYLAHQPADVVVIAMHADAESRVVLRVDRLTCWVAAQEC